MNEIRTFNAQEQKLQDVLRAIDTIEPVIGIIRKMYNIEREQDQIYDECITNNGKIEAYGSVLEITSDEALISKLNAEVLSLEEKTQELIFECNALEELWYNLVEEVEQYEAYINSFEGLDVELVHAVFDRTLNKIDARKFLSIILLFTNESVIDEEVFKYLLEEVAVDKELNKAIKESYTDLGYLYEFIATTALIY